MSPILNQALLNLLHLLLFQKILATSQSTSKTNSKRPTFLILSAKTISLITGTKETHKYTHPRESLRFKKHPIPSSAWSPKTQIPHPLTTILSL